MSYEDNLKQYRNFQIRRWLQENDDLLDAQWHQIPRTYPFDPVRGYRQRYTRVPDREGFFRFRSESRPSQYRKNADGTPVLLWRVEARYVFGAELDAIFDAKNEWPDTLDTGVIPELLASDKSRQWEPENVARAVEATRERE